MNAAVPLGTAREIGHARALVEGDGLCFEDGADEIVGVYEGEQLIATAARAGYVFKMFAIAPEHRGSDIFGELVTELLRCGRAAGEEVFFVFTRPEYVRSFEAVNFRLLVTHGGVALLEFGGGLARYLDAHAGIRRPGANGAIVVNANPFTLGHQHLVETAAAGVETLYLFVVREDRSIFPFSVRERLVREGTAHLPNVRVLETSRYSISAATFPSYFLKRLDAVALAQMQIDLRLFASRIAPYFGVGRRFVGAEPFCDATAAYNRTMAEVMPEYGITLAEIPRKEAAGGAISATRVREALARNDFGALTDLVPAVTLEFLRSGGGRGIAVRLATMQTEGSQR
jgi:[citrate (pro-3S)-lyase] ligase